MKRVIGSIVKPLTARLGAVTNLVMLGLIALAVLQAAQAVFHTSSTQVGTRDARAVSPSGATLQSGTIADIFFRDLSPSGSRAAPKADSSNIKLFGTRPSENGFGTAILSTNGKTQAVFRTGQALGKGAVLTAVYADRVEISRKGDVRSIFLNGPPKSKQRKLLSDRKPNSTSKLKPKRTVPPQAKPANIASPSALAALDLTPSQGGLKIGPQASSILLLGLGLSEGDILTMVNNKPVTDTNAMTELARDMENGGPVTVSLSRNGATETISINTDALKLVQMGQ